MKKKEVKYKIINGVIIFITAILFMAGYGNINEIFINTDFFHILTIVLTVIIVHTVKAGRLYLALYGSDIEFINYLKIYCKVTPVSVVFPFKLGEFFRMYCYGHQLMNYLKGIIIVLLDRFMDTTALLTMILLVWSFRGGQITSFVYVLLFFLVFVMLIYFVFPGVYRFWKKYIIKSKATESKLAVLKILDMLNLVYNEITNVTQGRGIILYFMSLIAWVVEIGCIYISNKLSGVETLSEIISEYLTSAMSNLPTTELRQFVFVSGVMLSTTYIVIKVIEMVHERRNDK